MGLKFTSEQAGIGLWRESVRFPESQKAKTNIYFNSFGLFGSGRRFLGVALNQSAASAASAEMGKGDGRGKEQRGGNHPRLVCGEPNGETAGRD